MSVARESAGNTQFPADIPDSDKTHLSVVTVTAKRSTAGYSVDTYNYFCRHITRDPCFATIALSNNPPLLHNLILT